MLDIPKISKASLDNKIFDRTETQIKEMFTGEELENALSEIPTEQENEWVKIFRSTAPGLERLKRKMAVCQYAEIDTITEAQLVYSYIGKKFEINAPYNSFSVSEALEISIHNGFKQMCKQCCIKIDGKILEYAKNSLGIDEIQLLVKIVDQFFFRIY